MRAFASILTMMAIASGVGCGGGEQDASPSVRSAVPPAGALNQDFAVFRGSRTGSDEIPKTLLPREIAEKVGVDLTTSRLARMYEGIPIFVATSPQTTCTFSRNYTVGNCWPTSTVKQGLATATSICGLGTEADEILTFGIVPDAVRKVTVLRANESDRTVRVVGNVYVAPSSSKPPLPMRLALHEVDRRLIRSTGIPPEIASRGCDEPEPGSAG